MFYFKDGKKVVGKVFLENDGKIILVLNVYSSVYMVELVVFEVIKWELLLIFFMFFNLFNCLNEEEIMDLFVYFMFGGDEEYYYYGGIKGLEEDK